MKIRRLVHVVAATITLIAPLAALAQPVTNGNVTTAPLSTAPTMGMSVLILLAVVLTGVAAHFLRRVAGRSVAVIIFAVVLTALAGIGYAKVAMIQVQGGQCAMATTQAFDANEPQTLISHCPNSIQIVSIQETCAPFDRTDNTLCSTFLGTCSVGLVLGDGDSCTLQTCSPC